VCHWDGTVNYVPSDLDSLTEWTDDPNSGSEEEFSELDGEELAESLLERLENEFKIDKALIAFEKISQVILSEHWEKAEKDWHLGYNGQSARTQCQKEQQAQKKEKEDSVVWKR
jgi:hypothetical protein